MNTTDRKKVTPNREPVKQTYRGTVSFTNPYLKDDNSVIYKATDRSSVDWRTARENSIANNASSSKTYSAAANSSPVGQGSNDRNDDAKWLTYIKQGLTDEQIAARERIINSPVTTTTSGPNSNTDEWKAYIPKNLSTYSGGYSGYGKYPTYSYSGIGGVGAFQASDAYKQAMAYTNSLLDQLNSGRTAYSDKIDALMSQIEGRDKFSYDFNTDPLFQNALASAMQSGQNAMQDTIGQASALTGGYGSSYATSAANQAYNSYIQDAYASLPDYYGIALDAYNQEGQDLYNQLGMYQTADATAYDRLYSAYSANLSNAQNMYNQEYSNYWDTANYNLSVAKYNADQKYNYDKLNASTYADYLSSLGKSTSTSGSTNAASADGEERINPVSDANILKTALGYAKLGTGEGSQYLTYLESLYNQGYNTNALEDYVESSLDPVYQKTTGGLFRSDDTVYTDQFGREYTYAELKRLYTDEELKKFGIK